MRRYYGTQEEEIQSKMAAGYAIEVQQPGITILVNRTVNRNGKITVAAYGGKRAKPDFHFYFSSEERAKKYIDEYINRQHAGVEAAAKRKAERKARVNGLAVGDILACSWGYEQTNVDFYQVVRTTAAGAYVRPIAGRMLPGGEVSAMSCYMVAVKDKFVGDEEFHRVDGDGFKLQYGWAHKIAADEKKYCSWYA